MYFLRAIFCKGTSLPTLNLDLTEVMCSLALFTASVKHSNIHLDGAQKNKTMVNPDSYIYTSEFIRIELIGEEAKVNDCVYVLNSK
jgi:hypothetical protein